LEDKWAAVVAEVEGVSTALGVECLGKVDNEVLHKDFREGFRSNDKLGQKIKESHTAPNKMKPLDSRNLAVLGRRTKHSQGNMSQIIIYGGYTNWVWDSY